MSDVVIRGEIARPEKRPIPKSYNETHLMQWEFDGKQFKALWRIFVVQHTKDVWLSVSCGRWYAQIPIKTYEQWDDMVDWANHILLKLKKEGILLPPD